ncbi:uncharacterized protein LOC142640011 [Castanea sativa]|uniref:uncharacterized protein LOC142640011 n=1 Tax=Castanea sativa TaxID=21020 RepID=UPI003F64A490
MDLDTNSIFVSKDVIFYEHIFPFASGPPSSQFSNPTSLDSNSDSFVFPHSVLDFSISDSYFLNDSSISFPDSADTVPPVVVDSEQDLVPMPMPMPRLNSPLPLKKSTRPHNPPSYLQDYSCKAVTSSPISSKPSFGMPYDIFVCLTYSNLCKKYKQFIMAIDFTSPDPTSFHEAVQSLDWRVAMDKETAALELTNTWTLTSLPPGKVPISCKWVYRTKYKSDGSIERHKTCLVAKGYTQREDLDYTDTFSPAAKSVSVKMILSLAAVKGWFLH